MFSSVRRPSPALLVAIVALVAALGGSALAGPVLHGAKAPTKRSGDRIIKKRSLSGDRLRLNSVGGAAVNEARLGKVPSAHELDGRTAADFAPADRAVAGSSMLQAGPAPDGNTGTVLERGPFTLRLRCTDVGGGGAKAELTLESKRAGSFANFPFGSGPVGPTTPRIVGEWSSSASDFSVPGLWMAVSPYGEQAQGEITSGLHKFGRDCLVFATAVG